VGGIERGREGERQSKAKGRDVLVHHRTSRHTYDSPSYHVPKWLMHGKGTSSKNVFRLIEKDAEMLLSSRVSAPSTNRCIVPGMWIGMGVTRMLVTDMGESVLLPASITLELLYT
jgi:hypothetical protein